MANKVSLALAAGAVVLLAAGATGSAYALSGSHQVDIPSAVQRSLVVSTEKSGDSWSYAGTVFGHAGCWQLTSGNGLSALFACRDGMWLGRTSGTLVALP